MKLYIGENIKRLRREREITQEQLADELGVSFQAVSRWEQGQSYPDVEMIPEIAMYFGVSADELMGVDEAAREKRFEIDCKRWYNDFTESAHWDSSDYEKRLGIILEKIREYPDKSFFCYWFIMLLNDSNDRSLQEKFFYEAMNAYDKAISLKEMTTQRRTEAEISLIGFAPEKELPSLLARFSTAYDMNAARLLASRYSDDPERQKPYFQLWVMHLLFALLSSIGNHFQAKLDLIDAICDRTGIPSTEREPGIFSCFYNRIKFSLLLERLKDGKKEEALYLLEEIVDEYERFFSLPDGTVLRGHCELFSDLREVLKVDYDGNRGEWWFTSYFDADIPLDDLSDVNGGDHCPDNLLFWLKDKRYSNATVLDSIRDDPRYAAIIERVSAVCESRKSK